MYKDWVDKLTNPYLIKDEDKNILFSILMEQRYDNNIPLDCRMECLDTYYDIVFNRWESVVEVKRPNETYILGVPVKLTKHWIWENNEYQDNFIDQLDMFDYEDANRFLKYLQGE